MPPSERGVARPWMGYPCQAKDKRQGPRRREYCGEPSRQARLNTGNNPIKPFVDESCSSMHRRHAAVLPPPPFSLAPKSQSKSFPSTGRHPPLGGGKCLRTFHSPNTAPEAHHHHPRPQNPRRAENVRRGRKPRLRKPRNAHSKTCAPFPEVRHPAAPAPLSPIGHCPSAVGTPSASRATPGAGAAYASNGSC